MPTEDRNFTVALSVVSRFDSLLWLQAMCGQRIEVNSIFYSIIGALEKIEGKQKSKEQFNLASFGFIFLSFFHFLSIFLQ